MSILNDEGGQMVNVKGANAFAFLQGDAFQLAAAAVAHALDFVVQGAVVNMGAVFRIDEADLDADDEYWGGFHISNVDGVFINVKPSWA